LSVADASTVSSGRCFNESRAVASGRRLFQHLMSAHGVVMHEEQRHRGHQQCRSAERYGVVRRRFVRRRWRGLPIAEALQNGIDRGLHAFRRTALAKQRSDAREDGRALAIAQLRFESVANLNVNLPFHRRPQEEHAIILLGLSDRPAAKNPLRVFFDRFALQRAHDRDGHLVGSRALVGAQPQFQSLLNGVGQFARKVVDVPGRGRIVGRARGGSESQNKECSHPSTSISRGMPYIDPSRRGSSRDRRNA
jgi:hypothetical protein